MSSSARMFSFLEGTETRDQEARSLSRYGTREGRRRNARPCFPEPPGRSKAASRGRGLPCQGNTFTLGPLPKGIPCLPYLFLLLTIPANNLLKLTRYHGSLGSWRSGPAALHGPPRGPSCTLPQGLCTCRGPAKNQSCLTHLLLLLSPRRFLLILIGKDPLLPASIVPASLWPMTSQS